jgi:hypothetical protein
LRKIRIERLLLEVNDLCGFTQQLRPLNEHLPQWENAVAVLVLPSPPREPIWAS